MVGLSIDINTFSATRCFQTHKKHPLECFMFTLQLHKYLVINFKCSFILLLITCSKTLFIFSFISFQVYYIYAFGLTFATLEVSVEVDIKGM
jgi:hypothetical protein